MTDNRFFWEKTMESNLIFWDIETTGLSPNTSEITQIAAVKTINGRIIERFNALVNIDGPVPPNITTLTGITKQMLTENGQPINTVLRKFRDFCTEEYALVAHNGKRFDSKFLDNACKNAGIMMENSQIDSYLIAKKVYPELENHKMGTLADYFYIELVAHRADNDAEALAKIFTAMLEDGRVNEKIINSAMY